MNIQRNPHFYSRRVLQIISCILLIVPLVFGPIGIIFGLRGFYWIFQMPQPFPVETDLDSDFRFLTANFFGWGLALIWMLPRIEKHVTLFRILALGIFLGGIGRLISLLTVGIPGKLTVALVGIE